MSHFWWGGTHPRHSKNIDNLSMPNCKRQWHLYYRQCSSRRVFLYVFQHKMWTIMASCFDCLEIKSFPLFGNLNPLLLWNYRQVFSHSLLQFLLYKQNLDKQGWSDTLHLYWYQMRVSGVYGANFLLSGIFEFQYLYKPRHHFEKIVKHMTEDKHGLNLWDKYETTYPYRCQNDPI